MRANQPSRVPGLRVHRLLLRRPAIKDGLGQKPGWNWTRLIGIGVTLSEEVAASYKGVTYPIYLATLA